MSAVCCGRRRSWRPATKRKRNEISADALRLAEDAAITEAVKLQESLGLQVVTDGEFRRAFWHEDFLAGFINVAIAPGKLKVKFKSLEGENEITPPGTVITGKLGWPKGGIFVNDFKFLKSVAQATPKMTFPSPTLMHFRGGRAAVDKAAYPDMDGFYADLARVYSEEIGGLAEAGCRYIQIDEVNFAFSVRPAPARGGARQSRRGSGDAAGDLRQAAQCVDRHQAGRHDSRAASVPRQCHEQLARRRRL